MSGKICNAVRLFGFVSSTIAMTAFAQCSAAMAQDVAGQSQDDPIAPAGQGDIVVVGKRAQNVRDIAGTVNIVSSEDLAKTGAKDAEDIFKLTPGVQFNKGSADGSLLSIRGIGTSTSSDNTSVGQLPTGIYIEDVPFTDPFQYVSTPDISAFDLDAVKVLRGPQGALYGSGSLGGAVNYTFKKPDLAKIGGSMMVTGDVAQGGEAQASVYAALNLPVATDKFALRFVGQYQNDPGYQDNVGTNEKNVNGRSVKGGRVLALYRPDDRLTIDALYIYQESHQGDTSASVGPDVRYYNSRHPSSYESRFSLAKLEVNYLLGPVKLTSLTAHQSKTRNANSDLTRLLVPDVTTGIDVPSQDFLGFGPFPQVKEARNIEARSSNGFSQEFRVASAQKGTFNWLVGVFGQDVNFHRTQNVFLVGANDPVYRDLYFNVSRTGIAKERAVFGEVELDIGGLELGAGGRYFHTSVSFDQVRTAALASSANSRSLTHTESGFTPKFEVRYRMPGNTVLYALAAKGFRFGGVNTAPGAAEYKSDNLWNYEAGIRLAPTSTLNLDVGAFYIDWQNPQITSADRNGFLIISNVGKAVSKGVELAIRWRPVQALRFNGSMTYTDAKTKAPFQSTRNFATDVAGGYTGNFEVPAGTRLPGTPKLQASFQPEFVTAGPSGTQLSLSGTLSYTGSRQAQIDSALMLPAYTTADLRAKVSKGRFEVGLGVSNLFNSKGISQASYSYYSTGSGTDGYADYYLIRPRVYSLSLKVDM